MTKPISILIESPDGAGKDTCINYLRTKFNKVKVYKFPSGKTREFIMGSAKTQKEIIPHFIAEFKSTLPDIKKDMENGYNIIINRMYLSTLMYGIQDGCDKKWIEENINQAIGDWKPTYTFILDIDPNVAQERMHQRAQQTNEGNWLDGTIQKQKELNKLYKDYLKENKNNKAVVKIDTNGTIQDTYKQIDKFITRLKTMEKSR